MERIHAGLEDVGFEAPASVKQATICSKSGLLAGKGCPSITEYFEAATIPTTRCTQHYVAPTATPTPTPEKDEEEDNQTKPTAAPTKTPTQAPTQAPESPDSGEG